MKLKIPTLRLIHNFKDSIFSTLKIDLIFKKILSCGISVNTITVIGIIFGFASIFFLFLNPLIFNILYLIYKFLDIIDGYLARKFHLESATGDLLDHGGDILIHSLLILFIFINTDFSLIPIFALITYIGEYILLRKQKLLAYKFPSSLFTLFFIIQLYFTGLIIQITYQIISYSVFMIYIKPKINTKTNN